MEWIETGGAQAMSNDKTIFAWTNPHADIGNKEGMIVGVFDGVIDPSIYNLEKQEFYTVALVYEDIDETLFTQLRYRMHRVDLQQILSGDTYNRCKSLSWKSPFRPHKKVLRNTFAAVDVRFHHLIGNAEEFQPEPELV